MNGSISIIRVKSVAETFLNQMVPRYGVPLEVQHGKKFQEVQDRNFESRIFRELSTLLGIKKTRTFALHLQSDGQVGRQN